MGNSRRARTKKRADKAARREHLRLEKYTRSVANVPVLTGAAARRARTAQSSNAITIKRTSR